MIKNTLLTIEEYVSRRNTFLSQMPAQSMALFFAAQEVTRSNDTEYLFCQDKNFYYLTGFNEPDAILVLFKDEKSQSKTVLFSRAKDALQEVWHGRRVGQQAAITEYGVDECYCLDDIEQPILTMMQACTTLFYCPQLQTGNDSIQSRIENRLQQWRNQLKQQSRQGITPPQTLIDCSDIIHEMRLHKSVDEIAIMRQANVISGLAHTRAMKATKAGKFEYQIEAELLHEFASNGARFAAYNSIVAGGDNANILHYTDNEDVLVAGDLLLIDAGAELAGYAADITRTFPVSGKFTEQQASIYQLVLDSQNLAISAIKPQQTLAQLNAMVGEFLTKGLYQLGILTGDIEQLIAENACKKYFIHGLGHWLGLDVHDVGSYHCNEQGQQQRAFSPGMILTIEPGIYIPRDDESVAEQWRGIAVRIEDNILVTETGYENLTVNVVKTIAEIETLMSLS